MKKKVLKSVKVILAGLLGVVVIACMAGCSAATEVTTGQNQTNVTTAEQTTGEETTSEKAAESSKKTTEETKSEQTKTTQAETETTVATEEGLMASIAKQVESAKEELSSKVGEEETEYEGDLGENIKEIIQIAADEELTTLKGQLQDTINLLIGQAAVVVMGAVDKGEEVIGEIIDELQLYLADAVADLF